MKADNTSMIGESELRIALRSRLTNDLGHGHAIIEEMGIENGSARIDVAVISDRICGYEIKSDFDNAFRLSNQIHAYNRVFEHICIVLGPSSATTIEGILPSWWGILMANRTEQGSIELSQVRPSVPNKLRDIYSLLTLFKREELNDLAIRHGLPNKLIKGTKPLLIDALAAEVPFNVVSIEAASALKLRALHATA